jgi:molybdate transport repressor ModE-like protein
MPTAPDAPGRRYYKELRLQQLRGFCETARTGSFSGAARNLDIAQATVWEQIRALEREFDSRLLARHGRGIRLTDDGRLLLHLIQPLVGGVESLKAAFEEGKRARPTALTVAGNHRVLVEDLAGPLRDYHKRRPEVRMIVLDKPPVPTAEAMERGEIDVGLIQYSDRAPQNPAVEYEHAYDLEFLLVTPRRHPLQRKAQVGPDDIVEFPLVMQLAGSPGRLMVDAVLQAHGLLERARPVVESNNVHAIQCYVGLGLGVAVIVRQVPRRSVPELAFRSMRRHFGIARVAFVWRRGAHVPGHIRDFADTVQRMLKTKS